MRGTRRASFMRTGETSWWISLERVIRRDITTSLGCEPAIVACEGTNVLLVPKSAGRME